MHLNRDSKGFAGCSPASPRILAACLSDSITLSLTLTTCPGWPGFWTQALGWKVLSQREREIVIGTDENAPVGHLLHAVAEHETDEEPRISGLTSSAQDRDQEIERLLAWGRADEHRRTGAESSTVLADPEGNEL